MKILINNKEKVEKYMSSIKEFRDELYLTSFPNENEREPFENILERIVNESLPKTTLQLVLENDLVVSGLISDYYLECSIIEPIYMVTRKEYRGCGYGKRFLEELWNLYPSIKHIFFETDNPEHVDIENSAMDPTLRLQIYKNWGFKVIPIDYVQPPLRKGGEYERGLLLMHKGENLGSKELKEFLYYFYKYLHYEDSEELNKMYKQIDLLYKM